MYVYSHILSIFQTAICCRPSAPHSASFYLDAFILNFMKGFSHPLDSADEPNIKPHGWSNLKYISVTSRLWLKQWDFKDLFDIIKIVFRCVMTI